MGRFNTILDMAKKGFSKSEDKGNYPACNKKNRQKGNKKKKLKRMKD